MFQFDFTPKISLQSYIHYSEKMAIKVFFTTKAHVSASCWARQFPGGIPRLNGCEFYFGSPPKSIDWVVVYEDLPDRKAVNYRSVFDCDQANTVLVTSEPSSIKRYSRNYLDQFGTVLTSQEPSYLTGRDVVRSQCGLRWFVGADSDPMMTWDDLATLSPTGKPRSISTVCSTKTGARTNHDRRLEYTKDFVSHFPDTHWFGKGIQEIRDKSEGLLQFQYHLCIENHVAQHHWTEKLADAFLGWTLPLYVGCPNVCDYFDRRSLIHLNIDARARELPQVNELISQHAFDDSYEFIKASRNAVLHEYNLFSVVANIIRERNGHAVRLLNSPATLYSRREIRKKNPLRGAAELLAKFRRGF